mmetsp:Transcript_44441/g.72361  ORF Transcript_44441/g.72361 Transcript_44441/m.72361 type:complete len:639 (+) Transcript_44441:180-2096(+)
MSDAKSMGSAVLDVAKSGLEVLIDEALKLDWLTLLGITVDAAGQAGICYGAGAVTSIAKEIIESVQYVKINKKRCRNLKVRIENMEPIVKDLMDALKSRQCELAKVKKLLESYNQCILDAGQLVIVCMKHNDLPKPFRWIPAKGDKDALDDLLCRMRDTLQDLSFALNAKTSVAVFDVKELVEEDAKAREDDMRDLEELLKKLDKAIDSHGVKLDGFGQTLNGVGQTLEDVLRILRQGENQNGPSSIVTQSLEETWKHFLGDGKLTVKEKEALYSLKIAHEISDETENKIVRNVLLYFQRKPAPPDMALLELQYNEYLSFKKERLMASSSSPLPLEADRNLGSSPSSSARSTPNAVPLSSSSSQKIETPVRADGGSSTVSRDRLGVDTSVSVAEHCKWLGDIAEHNDGNRVRIVKGDGVPVILNCMARHVDSATVQEEGLRALSILAYNLANRALMAGGIPAALTAMQNHPKSSTVQERGCLVLGSLTANTAAKTDNCELIGKSGGITLILDAMKQDANSMVAQEGLRALINLANKKNDANRIRIGDAEGIPVILNAMKQHADSSKVQERGCWALAMLAQYDPNSDRIAQADGINVILNAMKRHTGSPDVQKWGREAHRCLVGEHESISLRLAAMKCI